MKQYKFDYISIISEYLLFFYLCYFSCNFFAIWHSWMNIMKFKVLSYSVLLSTLPLTSIKAAGLDRSGQSISAFLQSGNYAEAGISVLDPTVKGSSTVINKITGQDLTGEKITDMGSDYYFVNTALKLQVTDQVSLGLIYDQPFGADALYDAKNQSFGNSLSGTSVEVKTQNLTALIGYQPTENWNFYAGPVWQTVEADINLKGSAYQVLNGYNIHVDQKEAYGWIAGTAYQIPKIALKASITYRSEIKHKAQSNETSLLPLYADALKKPEFNRLDKIAAVTEAVTPQSVNIDLQSGIATNTLAFANLRWVHWDQFTVTPKLLGLVGQDLISYSDDQYSATLGVAHKFNDQWAATTTVGYDSGAGNPVTTLGPTEGYWSVGLGGQFNPSQQSFIQAGVKYFWLGDATAQTGGINVGEFSNNYALGYGMKIGYRF